MENNNHKKTIAVVVPTCRQEQYERFVESWGRQFDTHNVLLVTVHDGERPYVKVDNNSISIDAIAGDDSDLIYDHSDVVRNLGFLYIAKNEPNIEYIVTLDDDLVPLGDTIGDHIRALQQRVPTTWMSTANEFMRGFPYGIRKESEVVLSHGTWEGVKDWDAPTQLQLHDPKKKVYFYKGVIPRGCLYPMSGMNIAFKRKMLPFMYFAPMGVKVGLDRFGDIWCGIESKRKIDEHGWAVVTGYSSVYHERASNVFVNLEKEAKGLRLNEEYGNNEYFRTYKEARERWELLVNKYLE